MATDIQVKSTFKIYEDFEDLPDMYKMLILDAQTRANDAYAPYSQFKVGASVLTTSGKIISGSNQENAAYPSGLCAERVALFYTAANHPNTPIEAIAVVAKKNNDWTAAMPCGACRQVIREYETRQNSSIKIVMAYKDGKYMVSEKAEDLLPFSFTNTDL